MDPFDALAISSSVPSATRLTGPILREILATGEISDAYWPHLNRALTELPLELLARVINTYPQGAVRDAAILRLCKVAAAVGAEVRIAAWLHNGPSQ